MDYRKMLNRLGLLALVGIIVCQACSKESPSYDSHRPLLGEDTNDYEVNQLDDVQMMREGDSHSNPTPLVFDIQTGEIEYIPNAEHEIEMRWDLRRSYIYYSNLNANTDAGGRLNFIDMPFDEVDEQAIIDHFCDGDADIFYDRFENIADFGINHCEYLHIDNEGWINYDFDNGHLVTVVENRTLLLVTRLNDDSLALYKIQPISVYKGSPEVPSPKDLSTPFYLSYKYQRIELQQINL